MSTKKIINKGRQSIVRIADVPPNNRLSVDGDGVDGPFEAAIAQDPPQVIESPAPMTTNPEDTSVPQAQPGSQAPSQPPPDAMPRATQPFVPLSLEEQRRIAAAKAVKKEAARKGPIPGDRLVLAEAMQVVETDQHNAEDAPRLMLRRVGKRKLSEAEARAVLAAGTGVEFVERKVVRTRDGRSKGEAVEVTVRADIVRFEGHPIVGDRSMWLKGQDG